MLPYISDCATSVMSEMSVMLKDAIHPEQMNIRRGV